MSWDLKTLNELFDIARGGSPRPIDKFWTDSEDGVNWIMISDATGSSKFITKTKKKIKKEGANNSRYVEPGDFILTNSMSFGRPYIMGTHGCIHDGWLVLKPKSNNVHQDFFYHLLGSNFIYNEFSKRAAGATVKNLNIELVKGVTVPVPPIEEQKRIADILDKADALRAKRRETIILINSLIQSIFLEMFGDPVSNPKDFKLYSLESVMGKPFQNGAYFEREFYHETSGVEMVHMSDAFGGTVKRGNLKRVLCSEKDIDKYSLSSSDILIARRSLNYEGSVKPTMIPTHAEPLIFESSLIRLSPDNNLVRTRYLYYYLSNDRVRARYVFPYVTKSTISGINQNNLSKILTLIPPIELQDAFLKRIDGLNNIHSSFVNSYSLLDSAFASIQQKAFSGKL